MIRARKDKKKHPGKLRTSEFEEKNKQLQRLIEINTYIANSLEKEEVLKRILNQTKILLNCERSSILLVDREMKQLNFSVLTREEDSVILRDTSLRMGEGIAGTVWQNGIPVVINDAQNDPRFSDRADKKARIRTRSIIAVPLTVNGEIIGVIEAINKIAGGFSDFDLQILLYVSTQSAIAINNADLYNMAIRDGMTRLFIGRYFRERLEEEWNRSMRKKHHLSIAIFDIDNFKSINDTYGHQGGDRVIKETARIIQKGCRLIDIPCRYGGEEFTVLMPETDAEESMAVANRVRALIQEMRIEYEDSTIRLTVSGGVASSPEHAARDYGELIEMADIALYNSKKAGRNRILAYDQNSMGRPGGGG